MLDTTRHLIGAGSIATRARLAWAIALLACLAAPAGAQPLAARSIGSLAGVDPNARLGSVVASAGDFNADGRADFAVGEPAWGPTSADGTGRLLIFYDVSAPHLAPDLELRGEAPGDQFGTSVASIGDINADGHDDLVVGAPGALSATSGGGSGRMYVYFGGPSPSGVPDLVVDNPPVSVRIYTYGFGASAAGLGDLSGDGIADWIVGFDRATSIGGSGGAIFYGGAAPRSKPAAIFSFGTTGRAVLAGIGDFNGDGRPDFAVGSPLEVGSTSQIRVCTGVSPPVMVMVASSNQPGLGSSLAPLGDINRDGYADFLAGQPRSGGPGLLWFCPGRTAGSPPAVNVSPSGSSTDSLGAALAAGDVLGDGSRVIAVGACGDDSAGAGAGAVYLYKFSGGPVGAPLGRIRGAAGDYFGSAVALLGNPGGASTPFLVAGASSSASGATRGGRADWFTFAPHDLLGPEGPGEFVVGSPIEFHWLGSAPADLLLSTDAGVHWVRYVRGVGGAADNRFSIAAPDRVSGNVLARVTLEDWSSVPLLSRENRFTFAIVPPIPDHPAVSIAIPLPGSAGARGRLGAALAGGSDLDGDGLADLAAGAPFADSAGVHSGRVWIRHGGPHPAPPIAIDGGDEREQFGAALSTGGDVDADGRADLLVGAPGHVGANGAAGRITLFTREGADASPWHADGLAPDEGFGSAVAILGDWSGDGLADVAAGAPFALNSGDRGVGRVSIFTAGASPAVPFLSLYPPGDGAGFGSSLARLDFNGDGVPDLAVAWRSTITQLGHVSIYYGGYFSDAGVDLDLTSGVPGDGFGAALAGGDLNGDGVDDLAIGAPFATTDAGPSGLVQLFLGGARPAAKPVRSYPGSQTGESFGAALRIARDLDDDGGPRLLVGAPNANRGRGACRSFRGARAGPEWSGPVADGDLGAALDVMGDPAHPGRSVPIGGAPFGSDAAGTDGVLVRLESPRYLLESPATPARWFAGGAYEIDWSGAEIADLSLSTNFGRTWLPLAIGVGGAADNHVTVRAPEVAADSALIRVAPSNPAVPGEARSGPVIAIERGGTLAFFSFTIETGGVRLTWSANPGVGPQGWSGYRLSRVLLGETAETRIGPDLVTASELLVPESRRGETYVLRAVDGLGVERELGRVTLPAATPGIRAWPMPSDEFGVVNLAMFPPVQADGRTPSDFTLRIYDVGGRRVLPLAGGNVPTRVGELTLAWDRHREDGGEAGSGVYFVRAECPSRGWKLERRIVLVR